MAAEGQAGAQAALNLLANPGRLLSVTQVGVTLASLGLGWAGEDTLYGILMRLARSGAATPLAAEIPARRLPGGLLPDDQLLPRGAGRGGAQEPGDAHRPTGWRRWWRRRCWSFSACLHAVRGGGRTLRRRYHARAEVEKRPATAAGIRPRN